ncbi:hypothetical protein P3S67_026526 [Capsicum chacoense]
MALELNTWTFFLILAGGESVLHVTGCLYHISHDSNFATCSTFLLSHTPHKEGISTYDCIIALRDQEQQGVAG